MLLMYFRFTNFPLIYMCPTIILFIRAYPFDFKYSKNWKEPLFILFSSITKTFSQLKNLNNFKLECIILSVPGIVQVSLFTWEYNLQKLANWFPIINYYCGIYIWTLALLTVFTEVLNIHIYVQSRSWLVPTLWKCYVTLPRKY